MLKSIKVLVAASFIVFIFLPLGSCNNTAALHSPEASAKHSFESLTSMLVEVDNEEGYLYKSLNSTNPANAIPLLVFVLPFVLFFAKEQTVSTPFGYYFFSLIELAGLAIFISYLYQMLIELNFHPSLFGYLVVALSAGYLVLLVAEVLQAAFGLNLTPTQGNDEQIG